MRKMILSGKTLPMPVTSYEIVRNRTVKGERSWQVHKINARVHARFIKGMCSDFFHFQKIIYDVRPKGIKWETYYHLMRMHSELFQEAINSGYGYLWVLNEDDLPAIGTTYPPENLREINDVDEVSLSYMLHEHVGIGWVAHGPVDFTKPFRFRRF